MCVCCDAWCHCFAHASPMVDRMLRGVANEQLLSSDRKRVFEILTHSICWQVQRQTDEGAIRQQGSAKAPSCFFASRVKRVFVVNIRDCKNFGSPSPVHQQHSAASRAWAPKCFFFFFFKHGAQPSGFVDKGDVRAVGRPSMQQQVSSHL